jgi:putative oxidoreductase
MTALFTLYARLIVQQRQSWFAIPLRLIVGYGFMEHGYAKLARGPDSFVAILHALGTPAPALLAWAMILVELFGGLAVLVGALVPLASIPMTMVLLVAIFTVHIPNGFSSIKLQSVDAMGAHFGQPGYETDLLYVAAIIALVLGGSGPLALDRLFFARMLRARGSRSGDASRRPSRHPPRRVLPVTAIALLCAVLLPAGAALAQEASASKEAPARVGNIWGGFNHQPTESQVKSAERARGIDASTQQQTLEAQIVQQLYQQVLKSAGVSRPNAAAG